MKTPAKITRRINKRWSNPDTRDQAKRMVSRTLDALEAQGLAHPDGDAETALSDLLADVMLYCDIAGISWPEVEYRAANSRTDEDREWLEIG